jgi:hypothetical protein
MDQAGSSLTIPALGRMQVHNPPSHFKISWTVLARSGMIFALLSTFA